MTMNQDNQGPGYGAGNEEFILTEGKKPFNRNVLVLLLITAAGAAMIYLMYLRGRGTTGDEDAATLETNQKVAEVVQKGGEDLKALDATLQKMEKDVAVMTADNGAGQVPTRDLKTNPFLFEKQPTDLPTPGAPPEDPKVLAAKVAAKVQIQMISYSPGGSNCILNNKLCSEGDQIIVDQLAFRIKQIAQNYVILENGLGEFRIGLRGSGL